MQHLLEVAVRELAGPAAAAERHVAARFPMAAGPVEGEGAGHQRPRLARGADPGGRHPCQVGRAPRARPHGVPGGPGRAQGHWSGPRDCVGEASQPVAAPPVPPHHAAGLRLCDVRVPPARVRRAVPKAHELSLIHISEPTRPEPI
eukprot:4065963-Pyramimonas_sp.AAC.1